MENSVNIDISQSEAIDWWKTADPDYFEAQCLSYLSQMLELVGPDSGLKPVRDSPKKQNFFIVGSSLLNEFKSYFTTKKEAHVKTTGFSYAQLHLLQPLMDYLNDGKQIEEGLFMKTGDIEKQKKLQAILDSGNDISSALATNQYESHDCANILKNCIRNLPWPLLEKQYNAYEQIPEMPSDQKQCECLQLSMHILPKENFKCIRQLIPLLARVCTNKKSKMSFESMATIFVPVLLIPKEMEQKEWTLKQEKLTKAVAFLLRNHSTIFRGHVEIEKQAVEERNQSNVKKREGGNKEIRCVSFVDREASNETKKAFDNRNVHEETKSEIENMEDGDLKKMLTKRDSEDVENESIHEAAPLNYNEASDRLCLFCPFFTDARQTILDHLKAEHLFDVESLGKKLTYYQVIKLINYIRRQTSQLTCFACLDKFGSVSELREHFSSTCHSSVVPGQLHFDQPEYFKPTLENDMFLSDIVPRDEEDFSQYVIPEDDIIN